MLFFNDPKRKFCNQINIYGESLSALIESGFYMKGKLENEFELRLKQYLNVDFFSGCASGTDAITLSLISSGIPYGSKVLVPAMTAQASVVAITRANMIPVFVDVDERGLIDIEATEKAIKTFKPAAILIVHLYGLTASYELIKECQKSGIVLVEDCAQAFGSKFISGEFVGTVGDFGAHSFYPTKNLSTFGDAGGISIGYDKNKLGEIVKSTAEYGWDSQREVVRDGFNSRIDELHCSIIVNQLDNFRKQSDSKKLVGQRYIEKLSKKEGLQSFASQQDIARCELHLFSILIEDPGQVDKFFREKGIVLGRHYNKSLPSHKRFREFQFVKVNSKSNASLLAEKQRSLPFFPYMLEHEIEHVLDVIDEYSK